MNDYRISARLDEESAQDLEYIKQATDAWTGTNALKYAIVDAARRLRESDSNGAKMKALLQSDFVGCAIGPKVLSVNYKAVLERDWAGKNSAG